VSATPGPYRPSAGEVAALGAFLAARDLTGADIRLVPVGDGHANLTYLASDDAGRAVVVRRPPPPPRPPGANDVLREAGAMDAVGRAGGVPVPRILATADVGEVFDVPFFVMSYVPGDVVTTGLPSSLGDDGSRRAVSLAMADTLAALHSIDWTTTGLRGRPEGSNLRQRARLARLVADADGRPPAEFADVDAWLDRNAPAESGAAIVHGDFRIGNVLLSAPDPARGAPPGVAAVLDWELATVADPLVDLGYLLASWAGPGASADGLTPIQELGSATAADGFATPDELAARYFAARGIGPQDPTWYTVLALWKLAVLYEYSRRRFEAGSGDPYYAGTAKVRALLAAARAAARLA
jgi:aminoglycoside phosphotransferase (APT) family kinase protein